MRIRSRRRAPILVGVGLALVLAASAPTGFLILGSLVPSGPPSGPEAAGSSGATSAPLSGTLASSGSAVEVAPGFTPLLGTAPLGPLAPATPMTVEVGLAVRDPSALAGLVSALYTPGTTEYRSFLDTTELASQFGASAASVTAARGYFGGFGLSAALSPDHLLLTVAGPSSRVGAAFGTTFEEYRGAGGGWFVSHPTPARLPAVAPWSGAYGLGNATPLVPAASAPSALRASVVPAAPCSGSSGALVPCQVWQAYNMTPLISVGTNGSGLRIAVVDAYSSGENQTQLASDLAAFASRSGITPGPVNFVYPDPAPGDLNLSANLGWSLEDSLDLEWARAAAPGATIDMTFSPDAGVGLYEAIDWIVAHQAANVISMSWGEPDVGVFNAFSTPCSVACNASTDGSYGLLSPVLAFAAAEGIGAFAASGDCGGADGTSGLSTNYPASDPDVTGVGGTLLTVDSAGNYISEVGWSGSASGASSPGCANQGGSGGGYAPFPRPWWQTGLPPGSSGRGVPDVALDAATLALIYTHGTATAVGGTSLSTPVWAGIAAVADQYARRSLGFLGPSLYAIASGANYARDFHDIVQGNNDYSAGPGWDAVTGLGTPRVATLVVDLAHPVLVSSSDLASFVYATPRYGAAPLTVTFHVNSTGGTGTYPLEGVSFGDGNASFASGGTATHTYAKPGVYSAQAYVADSIANYSLSPPVGIVVGGGSSLTVTLVASTDLPALRAPVLFTVGVSGGVAPYEYNYSFGDGTFLYGAGSASESHVFGARGSFCASVVVSDAASPPDGGTSARVAIGVGGSPLPDCRNDTVPLTMVPTAGVGVRDAPADFPDLFTVSGGSTAAGTLAPSVQYSSSDPYLAACECAIFRTSGTYAVTGYGNDSENEQAVASTTVTVAPVLVASFTASPAYGTAPLTVAFGANASGGYGTDVATTAWTFGDGTGAVGTSASFTYTIPGLYVAVGHLSDLGHGNASEAFVIDVRPASGTPAPSLTATVRPAVDVPAGASVNFSARSFSANGSAVPSVYRWTIAPGSGAFASSFDWTLPLPLLGSTNRTLEVTLAVTDNTSATRVNASIVLGDFVAVEAGGFVPRVDALALSDSGGPVLGAAPLSWSGSASAAGPGTTGVDWAFGDGFGVASPIARHTYAAGEFTARVTAHDTFADTAVDVHPVEAYVTFGLSATLSAIAGTAPLTVHFRSNATGGPGPQYAYLWKFGNNASATSANGTHTFVNPGVYSVSLNASDAVGDSLVRNWTVTVMAAPSTFPAVVLLLVGAAGGVALALAVATRRARRGPPSP